MRSGGLWGIKGDQVKRLKELEAENARLRGAVSDLTLDKMILPEAGAPPTSASSPRIVPMAMEPDAVYSSRPCCRNELAVTLEWRRVDFRRELTRDFHREVTRL